MFAFAAATSVLDDDAVWLPEMVAGPAFVPLTETVGLLPATGSDALADPVDDGRGCDGPDDVPTDPVDGRVF